MTLNQIQCNDLLGNTGFGDCCYDPKEIIGAIHVPCNTAIDAGIVNGTADVGGTNVPFLTYLTNQIHAALRSNRFYPFGTFEEINATGADAKSQTLGYGRTIKTGFNNYNWQFTLLDCGFCLLKALKSHNGSRCFFFITKSGHLIGTQGTRTFTVAGVTYTVPALVPIKGSFSSEPWTPPTGAAVAGYKISYDFSVEQINENFAFVAANTTLESSAILKLALPSAGLQTMTFNELFNAAALGGNGGNLSHTTTTIQLEVRSGCDAANVSATYATLLANPSRWKLINTATGAVIAIASVIYNAATNSFTITHPVQTVGTQLTISLADPTVLLAAGISGIDSSAYTWTV